MAVIRLSCKVAVLKQQGTISCENDISKMSVITSASWLAHVLVHGKVCYQSWQLYSYSFGYWQLAVVWRWSRLNSWVFVQEIKVSIKCIKHGLTKRCGSSCCCILWYFGSPANLSLGSLVLRSLSSLCWWLYFVCLIPTFSFAQCCCMLFWLWKEPWSLCLSRPSGWGMILPALCDHHVIKTVADFLM